MSTEDRKDVQDYVVCDYVVCYAQCVWAGNDGDEAWAFEAPEAYDISTDEQARKAVSADMARLLHALRETSIELRAINKIPFRTAIPRRCIKEPTNG